MHDIFIIKEILQHILSFVPRKLIMPCVITCKSFHDAIKIDHNQDNVAKNSDMFSLLKIPYSSKAIINIAGKYKNNEIVLYLINKNLDLLGDLEICKIIGYIGNEYLLSKLIGTRISRAIVGICEGSHIDLFEKYKNKLYRYDLFDMVKAACKTNCIDMIHNVINYATKTFIAKTFDSEDMVNGEIFGKCANENGNDIILYIKNLMTYDDFVTDYISPICEGLIEGNHYDILVWFLDEEIVKNNGEYYCENFELVKYLIINNKFKMFSRVLSKYCLKWIYEGYNIVKNDKFKWAEDHHLDFCALVDLCIDYRRIEILTFLITDIRFNLIRHQEFLNKSQLLNFDDVTNVFITNSHLFIDYKE